MHGPTGAHGFQERGAGRARAAWIGLGLVYVTLVAISWKRWANPIVDCGREMYVPWQLSEGRLLYRDLFFLYGPVVPYWHALLFHLLGVHLNVLYGVGLLIAAAHAALVFALACRVVAVPLAAATTALFLTEFVFNPSINNLVFPYSFNASYASLGTLTALWAILRVDQRPEVRWRVMAGAAVALACLAKPEIGAAGALLLVLHAGVETWSDRARSWRPWCAPALALALTMIGYGPFAWSIGVRRLIDDYLLPQRTLAAMATFEQRTVGTALGVDSVRAMVAGTLFATAALAGLVAVAYLVERRVRRGLGGAAAALIGSALLLSPCAGWVVEALYRNRLHAANLAYLVLTLALLRRASPDARRRDLRWITLAALLATCRAPLFAGVSQYSAFFMPASMVVLAWLWGEGVPVMVPRLDRRAWRAAVVGVIAVWATLVGVMKAEVFRGELTYPVSTERGEMIVQSALGPSIAGLLAWLRTNTRPDEPVLLVPEDNAVHFLAGRRAVGAHYQLAPGLLSAEDERAVVAEGDRVGLRVVSVSNRTTADYGTPYWGTDYDREIGAWLRQRFHVATTFGVPVRPPAPSPARLWPPEGYGVEVYVRDLAPESASTR